LGVPQFGIETFVLQQLIVRASFADFSIFQDENLIGIHHGRQTMGNTDAGSILCGSFEST
jgi:hypothetical protein